MTLTEPVIKLICKKFKGEFIFIGEDIRSKMPQGFINQLEIALKPVDTIDKAFIFIENDVGVFCCPVVFTDSIKNCAPYIYEYKSINKANNVAMFIKRDRMTYKNPYIEQNLYKINDNPFLYRLLFQRMSPKKKVSISTLWNQYRDFRLVIVGGGESWQWIEWKRKASDIMVMIVNYNFTLNANFLIYNDKKVGRDLETIKFNDKRQIIGFKNHISRVTDFTYEVPQDAIQVSHTGAIAIQIAEKMGFKKVYLAGFDYKKNRNGNDQVYKKDKNDYYKDSRIKRFIKDFDKFKTERTYNLNKKSNLQKLPFVNKEELYEFSK